MAGPRLQHASLLIPPDGQAATRAFYSGVLGLEEKEPPQSLAHLQVIWFAVGEGEMELHFLPTPDFVRETSQRHICLVVDDLAAYQQRLTAAGVDTLGADPIPNRPRFFCRDPFGNLLEFATILGDYNL